MVTIDTERVADALHVDEDELPSGVNEDIAVAKTLIESRVEPHADSDDDDLVESTAVLVAAAFVAGTEGDAPISSVQTENSRWSVDVSNMSDEMRDLWARAMLLDPTNQLRASSGETTPFVFNTSGRDDEGETPW